MLDWLTPELDLDIRMYARWLDADNGEDAYHNTMEWLLRRPTPFIIQTPAAFLRVAVKRNVLKIWRHNASCQRTAEQVSAGQCPDSLPALQRGRLPHTHCRRGHEFTADNLIYVGTARTCKTCEHMRRAKYKERT